MRRAVDDRAHAVHGPQHRFVADALPNASFSEGHRDKLADRISDAVLDEFLRLEPAARVTCETLPAEQCMMVAGEFKTHDHDVFCRVQERAVPIVADALRDAGFRDGATGIGPSAARCRCDLTASRPPSIAGWTVPTE